MEKDELEFGMRFGWDSRGWVCTSVNGDNSEVTSGWKKVLTEGVLGLGLQSWERLSGIWIYHISYLDDVVIMDVGRVSGHTLIIPSISV